MNKLELIKKDLEEGADYNFDNWNKGDLQMLEEIVIATENVVKKLTIPVVVQAKPEKVCELIRQKFDDWVFGLETQAGEKLKVVDSTDFNEIITEIENELKDLQNL